jgi:hypothetical protein
MIKRYDPTKLEERFHGPYSIVRVYTNGNAKVRLNELTEETFNIREIFSAEKNPIVWSRAN